MKNYILFLAACAIVPVQGMRNMSNYLRSNKPILSFLHQTQKRDKYNKKFYKSPLEIDATVKNLTEIFITSEFVNGEKRHFHQDVGQLLRDHVQYNFLSDKFYALLPLVKDINKHISKKELKDFAQRNFVYAIRRGDPETIKRLLHLKKAGFIKFNLNTLNINGRPLMQTAAEMINFYEQQRVSKEDAHVYRMILKMLLEAGAKL